MTEPRASFSTHAEGERVVSVTTDARGILTVVTQFKSRRTTYYGVPTCDLSVGDTIEEPLRHRWRTVSMAWSSFDGDEED